MADGQFTRQDLPDAVVAHFDPFSVRIMLTQIDHLLADLAEAKKGWAAASMANRGAVVEVDRLRNRIADLQSTIVDLELRASRGET